ncbi:MAG: SGNH/GDSL hydrolase family protein [Candidatus Thermoplasmatota archaeon]|nr:SGNH/GDSL hydrolase family protein [Candidatus Thermoplasmatota archaeon]
MGWRRVLLIVTSLILVSTSGAITVHANITKNSEGASMIIENRIIGSDEPLEATIGLWGLSLGRTYQLHWWVHATNDSSLIQHSTAVSSGSIPFFANQSSRQIDFQEYHISNDSMMYILEIGLNSSTGWTNVSVTEPFSVFRRSMSPQYSEMYVFGDSLSDSGNTYSAFGTPASPPYWSGRYSDGKNWVDFTQSWMGHSNIAGRGTASGNNRAFGAAATGDGTQWGVIVNIGKQVDDWDQNNNLGPTDAVALFGGGNDFLNYGATNAQSLVDNLERHAEQLIATGGENIIFFELPALDKTPSAKEGNSQQENEDLAQRVSDFNSALWVMANDMAQNYNVTTHVIPIWDSFEMLFWSGEHFGITNVTHPACDHDGATCDSNDPIAPNKDEYIFFDKLHPTQTTHYTISLIVQQEIGISDYDGDNVADYLDNCPRTLPGIIVTSDGCEAPPADTDDDGVIDDFDLCPETESGMAVDENGCAVNQLDGDSDGVTDDIDQCPNTGIGESVDSVGCSDWQIDSDEDGVVNANDDCDETYLGSEIDQKGCADYQLDTDNDGITDDLDACSTTPREEIVNAVGCSNSQLDDDADGIVNSNDNCPFTPPGEVIDTHGCSASQRDTDEDGITDDLDLCPDTQWLAETNGEGCSAEQRDSDGDGRKDSLDPCPNIWGSLNGCPILIAEITLLQSPNAENRTAEISLLISCESGCEMDWVLQGKNTIDERRGVRNDTFYISYTNVEELSQTLDLRLSVDGIWKDASITIYFPPFNNDNSSSTENNIISDEDLQQEEGGSQNSAGDGLTFDSSSVAMIAMLLLVNIGVLALILSARNRTKASQRERNKAISSFEDQLFGSNLEQKNTQSDSEVAEIEPEIDLPKMGDLI